MIKKLLRAFGFCRHEWLTDLHKTNGYYWRFCKHCDNREANNDGHWRPL